MCVWESVCVKEREIVCVHVCVGKRDGQRDGARKCEIAVSSTIKNFILLQLKIFFRILTKLYWSPYSCYLVCGPINKFQRSVKFEFLLFEKFTSPKELGSFKANERPTLAGRNRK